MKKAIRIGRNLPRGSALPGNENRSPEEILAVVLDNAKALSRGQFRPAYHVHIVGARTRTTDNDNGSPQKKRTAVA